MRNDLIHICTEGRCIIKFYNQNNIPNNEWTEKIILAICILFLTGIGLGTLLLPDTGPVLLKEQLSARGISIEEITFTQTDKWKKIYQSSAPIDIGDGNTIEYWTIKNISLSTYFSKWKAFPFPEEKWPARVNVQLSFSAKEYEKLRQEAGDIPLDMYIMEILLEKQDD